MMFQTEMENLELGLNLRSSDLLFPDDLLNIPADQTNGLDGGNVFEDEVFADVMDCKMDQEDEQEQVKNDILAQIIEDIKLPTEMDSSADDVSFWPLNEDISFVDANQVQPVGPVSPTSSDSSDDTQTLIDEMEEFLVKHETVEEKINNTVVTQNMEVEKAEEILDALMNGNISLNDTTSSTDISNISEIKTGDGQNVIIVITNDTENGQPQVKMPPPAASPALSSMSTSSYSPSPSSICNEDTTSDSDWSPSEYSPKTERKSTRDVKKRGPYKRSKPYNIKDKKERKKMQNVVAARRYRDKKKNEQFQVEGEVDILEAKNKDLKKTLSEKEGELKTLKKLMIELGLVKINKQQKIVTL